MKKIYLYGNWKMNMSPVATLKYCENLVPVLKPFAEDIRRGELQLGIFPTFLSITVARVEAWHQLKETPGMEDLKDSIIVGAQNGYFEPKGAFTGEISIQMLKADSVSQVIIGHSERRHIFGESDELIARKIKACMDEDMTPILCYGETLEERERDRTFPVMERQIRSALSGLTPAEMGKIIYAYEPVWAIGTGKSATSEQAQEVCAWSKKLIAEIAGKDVSPVVLYGGSVKGSNAKELLSMEAIDGALVGGASLKPDTFLEIYAEYKK